MQPTDVEILEYEEKLSASALDEFKKLPPEEQQQAVEDQDDSLPLKFFLK